MSRLIINFQHANVMEPMPWPIGLTGENVVTSGLGNDDGALLIGFGVSGSQSVDVYVEDARENPASVIGLVPTFSHEGKFFEWSLPVAELAVIS